MELQLPISVVVDSDAFIAMIGHPRGSSASRASRDEIAPAHQVVGGRAEAKQPVDKTSASVPQFAEERDGLQPAKGLFDQLPLAMADAIPGVSGRARVDRAAPVSEFVLRDMPARPAGEGAEQWRAIRVTVSRPGVTVRAREGYVAGSGRKEAASGQPVASKPRECHGEGTGSRTEDGGFAAADGRQSAERGQSSCIAPP